jgi:hypothetical protein
MRESGLGHDMQSYRSEVMAKAAVDMHVDARAVSGATTARCARRPRCGSSCTNNTGHGLPDG